MANDFKNDKHKDDKASPEKAKVVATPGIDNDSTRGPKPEDNKPLVKIEDDATTVRGQVDPDFDPSTVPALEPFPLPHAVPPEGVTKDSSASAKEAPAVPVLGWVDHDVVAVDGTISHRHGMGPVLVPNAVPTGDTTDATANADAVTPKK